MTELQAAELLVLVGEAVGYLEIIQFLIQGIGAELGLLVGLGAVFLGLKLWHWDI